MGSQSACPQLAEREEHPEPGGARQVRHPAAGVYRPGLRELGDDGSQHVVGDPEQDEVAERGRLPQGKDRNPRQPRRGSLGGRSTPGDCGHLVSGSREQDGDGRAHPSRTHHGDLHDADPEGWGDDSLHSSGPAG